MGSGEFATGPGNPRRRPRSDSSKGSSMIERPYDLLDPDEMVRWDQAMRRMEDLACGVETDDQDDQVEEDDFDPDDD